ncbi:uracil-DNA glycosylase [Buchnera aphidicola (Mollitrichosiphum nigrofasciatum)]|uniref:uracil-DNA glycosylase n=1 Tax=Buchnera aphidicola TaxID=9 RepID=UPI0031B8950A
MNKKWCDFLNKEKKKKYFINIIKHLNILYCNKKIYPKKKNIFKAFYMTELSDIQVVILGQDPYFRSKQAHGLAFSVPCGIKIPPTLKNIYRELINDYNKKGYIFNNGCLMNWAKQGVFLLNTILTVESGKPFSHMHLGWSMFTDKVISIISKHCIGVVFLLWGNAAQKKKIIIDESKHFLFTASHPSPFSANRGFFGCRHFSKTNNILCAIGGRPINWFL